MVCRLLGLVVMSLCVYGYLTGSLWFSHKYDLQTRTNHGRNIQQDDPQQLPVFKQPTRREDNFTQRFPECLVIGARKGGTRALQRYLNLHPDIQTCVDEPHFFGNDNVYRRGLDYYKSLMPRSYPHQITIEKSPSYLHREDAPKRIHMFNKTIKLVVTLRHPVERLISDFWHFQRHNETGTTATFEEAVMDIQTGELNTDYEPLNVSLYYIHIQRYFEVFPREQILIVDGDNLIVNPVEEIAPIETFLGLEHRVTKDVVFFDPTKGFYCFVEDGKPTCLGEDKGHTHPDVDPAVYRKLMDYFKPFNEKLFSLLGRRFNWD